MKFLFLDNSELSSNRVSINSLGGFIIDSDVYSELSTEFRDLKVQHGMSRNTPVKWSPDSDGVRYADFRALPNINQFRREALRILSSKDIKIVCCFINNNLNQLRESKRVRRITKSQYKDFILDYNKRSLEYVAQRFQKELEETDHRGQIIIEFNSDSALNSALGEHYRIFHTNGSGGNLFELTYKNLEDGLLFSHDFCCDGIELADFVTSSLTHALRSRHYGYIDIFKDRIRNNFGRSKGYGIVVYPSTSIVADNLISRIDS